MVGECTATAAEASSTATRRTLGSLVDADRATIELNVIHSCDGGIGSRILRKAYEAEATTTPGISVLDDDLWPSQSVQRHRRHASRAHSLVNLAELLELLAQGLVVGVPCEATAAVSARVRAHASVRHVSAHPINSLDIVRRLLQVQSGSTFGKGWNEEGANQAADRQVVMRAARRASTWVEALMKLEVFHEVIDDGWR
ncbi:hypothetical protein LTR53_012157 [Teratosphaeriaceae sp. CCFEE 6253]|nr:hypothetical protein LTR53_012157 [Teratosphaeriaceae sp. CCFEE 6253]